MISMEKLIDKLQKIDRSALQLENSDAAALLHNVLKAYKAIVEKRENLDKAGLENEILNIVIGEDHNATDALIAQSLIAELIAEYESTPVIAGLEIPHDQAPTTLYDKVSSWFQSNIIDKDGWMSLRNELRHGYMTEAPKGLRTFLNTLLNKSDHIVSLFNDASINYEGHDETLNLEDPKTADAAKSVVKDNTNVKARSKKGLYIRNICMIDALTNAAKKYKSRITIQSCGINHVNGNDYDDTAPKSQSICSILNEKAQHYFAVFLCPDPTFPQDMPKSNYHMFNTQFSFKPEYEEGDPTQSALEQKEIDHIRGIYSSLGLTASI